MVKERISLSISGELLKQLDRDVDGNMIKSRSEAVEGIIAKHISNKKKAVILAGGNDKNLLSGSIPRPLLKINGITLIEDTLAKVRKAGFEDIILVGSKEILSEIYKTIGENQITYVEEKTHQGTAKTLQLTKDHIRSTFLFLPCDHYFELDLKAMEEYHKKNRGVATLAVYAGTKFEWTKSSIVEVEGNKITKYIEHPKVNTSHLTSLMIGFAEPELFELIPRSDIPYSLQEDVFPELAKQENLIGFIFSGTWKNIHSELDCKSITQNNTKG